MRAEWNVLLDHREHHPAFAQAVGTAGMPRARTDPPTIWCTAVTAGPADHAAEMHRTMMGRKSQIANVKCNGHKVLARV